MSEPVIQKEGACILAISPPGARFRFAVQGNTEEEARALYAALYAESEKAWGKLAEPEPVEPWQAVEWGERDFFGVFSCDYEGCEGDPPLAVFVSPEDAEAWREETQAENGGDLCVMTIRGLSGGLCWNHLDPAPPREVKP